MNTNLNEVESHLMQVQEELIGKPIPSPTLMETDVQEAPAQQQQSPLDQPDQA